jgi:hypothetical protein
MYAEIGSNLGQNIPSRFNFQRFDKRGHIIDGLIGKKG